MHGENMKLIVNNLGRIRNIHEITAIKNLQIFSDAFSTLEMW